MNLNFDIKNPKRYYLVTVLLADGKSTCGICHSFHPHGAIRTVISAPSTQSVIGGRRIVDVAAEPLDEYESILKDDFCVQTSKDGLHWIPYHSTLFHFSMMNLSPLRRSICIGANS